MKKYEQMVWKYLKGNKKRTVSTMFGVAFGALLIFAVINITFCLIRQGIMNAEKVYHFDAVFYELSEEQEAIIKKYPGVETVYGGAIHPNVFEHTSMVLVDDFDNNPYEIRLVKGVYPKDSHEILMEENMFELYQYDLGEVIQFGSDARTHTEEEMEFVIAGTFSFPDEYSELSTYQYKFIDYIGLLQEDSYQQLKDCNAVFVKYKNPYRIKSLTKEIGDVIGADYIINDSIAIYYNQTSDGSSQAVIAAIVLFIVVFISLMALVVIKNTLRISVAERMKDYGVLRCAGASLKQLKKLVIEEALFIGGVSALLGIIVSYVVLLRLSTLSDYYNISHFFLLAMLLTMLIVEVTMLISTLDPCKMLAKSTPVEAVRNHVRSGRNEIYKVRKVWLITKVFGIEGAYAYKNAMRSPKQFVTKVIALTIGVLVFVCPEIICETYLHKIIEETEIDKYYNIVIEPWQMMETETIDEEDTSDEAALYQVYQKKLSLIMEDLQTLDDVGETVGTFYAEAGGNHFEAYNFETADLSDRYTEEYKATGTYAQLKKTYITAHPDDESDDEKMLDYASACDVGEIPVFSYDESLLSTLEDALIDGTCNPEELGEDGIILNNTMEIWEYNVDTGTYVPCMVQVYNYKIGDQITLITAPADEWEKRFDEIEDTFVEKYQNEMTENEIRFGYMDLMRYLAFQELFEDGYYKTYTIKGIISEDTLLSSEAYPDIGLHYIMTKEQMQELYSWYDMDYISYIGMHVDGYNKDVINLFEEYGLSSDYTFIMLDYEVVDRVRGICDAILAGILVFMTINIFNTTANSIVFRKREFALLRCVGMSKKKLSYMILLESILALIMAIFFGGLISLMGGYGIYRYLLAFLKEIPAIHVPFIRIAGGMGLLLVIMMLAAWIPLQSVKKEIAPVLAEENE